MVISIPCVVNEFLCFLFFTEKLNQRILGSFRNHEEDHLTLLDWNTESLLIGARDALFNLTSRDLNLNSVIYNYDLCQKILCLEIFLEITPWVQKCNFQRLKSWLIDLLDISLGGTPSISNKNVTE
jgi:hypothetical protein